jgi:hypothetical protein
VTRAAAIVPSLLLSAEFTMRLRADFNGLFGDLLCLSHSDTAQDEEGNPVRLESGMAAVAYDDDVNDDGQRDNLLAAGVVEPSPAWLSCNGSRWVLRINQSGVQHESDL